MQNLKILIIEDNPIQADSIQEALEEFGYEVCGPAYNSTMAMHLFKKDNPDLVFVDIKLEGSPMDGIQLVEQFKKNKNIPIIFLSGNYDSVTRKRAKRVRPNHFLGKPYYPHQLDISIDFALHDFMNRQGGRSISGNTYSPFAQNPEYIFVKHHSKYVRININDILYMKADGSTTQVFLHHRSYAISTNLSDFVEKLNSNLFVITHRSYAVNLHAVESFDSIDAFIVRDLNLVPIPISAAKRTDFLEKIRIIRTK